MQLTDIFLALGEDGFQRAVRSISISRLKTYQLYESMKARARLPKLNVAGLKKVTPKLWERLGEGDGELAEDLAQAVLVCNLDMIIDVLNHIGIAHSDGFFDKDIDAADKLDEGWQQRVYEEFKEKYPGPVLVFYLNHLAKEVTKADRLFTPAGAD